MSVEPEYFCECGGSMYCIYCNPDKPVDLNKACVEMEKKLRNRVSACCVHDEHCSVCGTGLNEETVNHVECKYTPEQLQNLMGPEIEHFRCDACYLLLPIIPRSSSRWQDEVCSAILFGIRSHSMHQNKCVSNCE
jgi:hypothetical protein